MPNRTETFITNNWKWLITVLIGTGILYSEFQSMKQDVKTNKRRTQNYIDLVKNQDQKIHNLELRITVLETTIDK